MWGSEREREGRGREAKGEGGWPHPMATHLVHMSKVSTYWLGS